MSRPPIPVLIVGGFLGSGKTSLLRLMLGDAPRTAVIVNEFGAVGLDHHLLRSCTERVELVGGGCACCTTRQDLVQALSKLLDDRDRGRIALDRVVIETSGLADPAPIVFTINRHPMLRHHFQVQRLIVTVDALNGGRQLTAHPEAAKQVLVADELVVTKLDLVSDSERDELTAELAVLNPAAGIRAALHGVLAAGELVSTRRAPGPRTAAVAAAPADGHADDARSLRIAADTPVDWLAFAVWLSMLLHARGEQVLRVKGLVKLEDGELVSVNGVQHVMHPPEHLAPGELHDPTPAIVFIIRGLDPDTLRSSFQLFQRLAPGGARSAVSGGPPARR